MAVDRRGPEGQQRGTSNFTGGKASSFWGYVGPLLFGTVLISALALLISFFVSVGIALFISHYAPKKLATALSYVVDLLAAIPSVIYGLLGILILNPLMYKMELAVFKGSSTHQYPGGANLISAVLVLALMILRKKFVVQYLFSFVVGFVFGELLDVHELWINVLPTAIGWGILFLSDIF